ncbi:hypothetical protein [Actinomyces faecalis]|uniref:hypothetical protein n=1 Tax=Actinomyces faecalis TaxID=2722820 RepID=UPI001552892F|nr:hypothetical protein [Actinomyces faecalis]
MLIVSSLRAGLTAAWQPVAASGPQPAPAESWSGQAVAGLVVCVLLLLTVGCLGLVWRHGRRLYAAGETIDQFWRGLEAVLIRHHRAAEDLVRQADARGLLTDGARERAESAVAFATMTGTPTQRARREESLHEAMGAVMAAPSGAGDAAAVPDSDPLAGAVAEYAAAWEEVETVGRRYSELVLGYNRLVASPFNILWNRRLGRQPAQGFTPEHPGVLHTVDVL